MRDVTCRIIRTFVGAFCFPFFRVAIYPAHWPMLVPSRCTLCLLFYHFFAYSTSTVATINPDSFGNKRPERICILMCCITFQQILCNTVYFAASTEPTRNVKCILKRSVVSTLLVTAGEARSFLLDRIKQQQISLFLWCWRDEVEVNYDVVRTWEAILRSGLGISSHAAAFRAEKF